MVVVIAIIAIFVSSGVLFILLSSLPPHITISYTYIHGTMNVTPSEYPIIDKIGYNGIATWVVFYLNITTTKSTTLNPNNNFYITEDNQPLIIMNVNGLGPTHLQSGKVTAGSIGFTLEGNVAGTFRLIYNGTADVTIA